MTFKKFRSVTTSFILPLLIASPAIAQSGGNEPWAEIEMTSFMVGIGGQSGDGRLSLPNLGTNCIYPFKVSGFGAGIQVNLSKVSAAGAVKNMTRVEDFGGQYSTVQGEGTVLAGGGGISMRNKGNNVTVELASRTQGIGLGASGQGMTVNMPVPPANAPRAYVLEFGFNKTWVNQESRAMLDQVVRAWKCRYANIWLFGHTDTVGREDVNSELSEKRAQAVRDYLIGAGVNPGRLFTQAKGEDKQLKITDDNVRKRTNRAVGVVIQE